MPINCGLKIAQKPIFKFNTDNQEKINTNSHDGYMLTKTSVTQNSIDINLIVERISKKVFEGVLLEPHFITTKKGFPKNLSQT